MIATMLPEELKCDVGEVGRRECDRTSVGASHERLRPPSVRPDPLRDALSDDCYERMEAVFEIVLPSLFLKTTR